MALNTFFLFCFVLFCFSYKAGMAKSLTLNLIGMTVELEHNSNEQHNHVFLFVCLFCFLTLGSGHCIGRNGALRLRKKFL